jgi:hypothetical protein
MALSDTKAETGAIQFTLNEESTQGLTDWKNEPNILQLKLDFQMSKPAHDTLVTKVRGWTDLMNVTGEEKPKKIKGRSSIQPKLIRRQAEWRYSALTEPFLGSNKLFKVSPTTWDGDAAAKQNELVLNWQFRTKFNRVKFIDDYVRTTVDEGTCVLRVGWCRNTIPVRQKAPVYTHYPLDGSTPEGQQQIQQFQQALQLREENPRAFDTQAPDNLKAALELYDEQGQASYAVQTGTQTVMVEQVIENRPTVEIVNLQNFYLDPSCNGDLDRALFAIVSFETNLAELKKQPKRYKNLDKVNWASNNPLAEPDHKTHTPDASAQFQDNLRKRVIAYEYWGFLDIQNDGELRPVVITWIGDTIIRAELNPFPDQKLPFIIVPYLPVKQELFGEPDAELLADNQRILGAVTRGMIDLMGRSANAQRGIAKGMLDALNKRRYENGEDYEFNPTQNPLHSIVEHKYPELPQSALQMVNLQNQEAEALTGVKSFGGGISGEAYGDVAAGIRGVLDAASKREMGILRRLAQGISMVGRKLISMNAVFLSDKEVVRVTNADFVKLSPALQASAQQASDNVKPGEDPLSGPNTDLVNWFITVNRQDLAGEYDLEVDISTAEVDDGKAKDMGFMLQTLGPSMPGMSQVILAEIADLKRMPALAHKIRSFKPEPDPWQEQMKQLQLQLLQAQVRETQTQADMNEAKAKESSSKADALDLGYVEQETGTAHARDMDRIQAQARGNQDLEVTKALVKPRKQANGQETKPNVAAAVGFNSLTEFKDAHPPLHPSMPIPPMAPQLPSAPVLPSAPMVDSPLGTPPLAEQTNPNLQV